MNGHKNVYYVFLTDYNFFYLNVTAIIFYFFKVHIICGFKQYYHSHTNYS